MPAGLGRRLIGYAADCLFLFVGLLAFQALLYPVNPIVQAVRDGRIVAASLLHLWVFTTATVPFLLYFASMVSSRRQSTLGMRMLGMRVETVAGSRVGFPRGLLRSAVLLVPFEVNHTLMFHFAAPSGTEPSSTFWIGLALVWVFIGMFLVSVLVSPRRQSVHDRVAGTVVVNGSLAPLT